MARIRQIKPEFFLDEDLAYSCCIKARLCFIGMWTIADREGRLEDRPARMKAQIFPYDDDIAPSDISGFIDKLEQGGFLSRYSVDGKRLIWIRSFTRHQHFHKDEQGSKLPEPTEDIKIHRASTVQAPQLHRSCTPTSTSTSTSTSTCDLRHTASGEIAPQSQPAAKRRRPNQKTGCPDLFEPSDHMKEWASSVGPNLDLKEETEKFLDFHRSRGNSFSDWDASWRNWIRNAVKFARNNGNGGGSPNGTNRQSAQTGFGPEFNPGDLPDYARK